MTDILRVSHVTRFINFTTFNVVLFRDSYVLVTDVRVSLNLHGLKRQYLGVVLREFGVILENALGIHGRDVLQLTFEGYETDITA